MAISLTYNLLSDAMLSCSSCFRSRVSRKVVYWLIINGHGIHHWCGQPKHHLCLATTKSAHLLLLLQPFGRPKLGNIPHRDGNQNVGPGLSIACAWISSCVCLGFCSCEMLATCALQLIISFHCHLPCPIFSSGLRALAQHKISASFLSAAVGRYCPSNHSTEPFLQHTSN